MKNLLVLMCLNQVKSLDPVIDDWAHINAPTLVFGGAEDSLPGSAALFRERMKFVAQRIPNGNGRLTLIPGLGHVPHMEAPAKTFPPLIAFLREGLAGQ
jgi:pimeloyl-ACP methyl ester carboxylesterase